jgi:hypothetical protein
MSRPKTLLAVPCPTHGDAPCPSASGCNARRILAGLEKRPPGRPGKSGTSGAERNRRAKAAREKG